MKSFKKLLSVLVMLAMLASFVPASIAASYSYEDQAVILNNLGIFKGTSATSFVPDLGGAVTREQGVIQLVRTLGKETAALAMTDIEADKILIVFSDAKTISSWSKKYIAWAVNNKIVAGYPNGKFGPQDALSGKAYAKLILSALGHTVDAAGYEAACFLMRDKGIVTWGPAPQGNLYSVLSFSEAQKFNDKEALIRDDLVALSYAALKLTYSNTASETVNIGGTTTNIGGQNYVVGGKNVVMTSMRNRSVIDVLINGKTVVDTGVTYTFDANKVNKDKAIAGFLYFRELKALAETAVAAYETAAITSLAAITAAEALKAAADTAVAEYVKGNVAGLAAIVNFNVKFNLNNAWIKADYDAFLARITARTTAIANAKAAEIAAQAAANTALADYKAAPIATLANITAAEALGVTAAAKINACVDAAFKTAKLAEKAAQDAVVAARKALLNAQIADATAAIDAFKNQPTGTAAQMDTAYALSEAARAKIALVEDPTAKADLTNKFDLIPGVYTVTSNSLAQIIIKTSKPIVPSIASTGDNINGLIEIKRAIYDKRLISMFRANDNVGWPSWITADLDSTGRVITLLRDEGVLFTQGEILTLSIDGIKDTTGVAFRSIVDREITISDVTNPVLLDLQFVVDNPNKLLLNSSEPLWNYYFAGYASTEAPGPFGYTMSFIDTATGIGKVVPILSIEDSPVWNANSLLITLGEAMAVGKTYKVTIDWAYDVAGLMAPVKEFSVTPSMTPPDVTAPALVGITTYGKSNVILEFSENVASVTGVTVTEGGTGTVLISAGAGLVGTDKKARINLSPNFTDAVAHHGFTVSATVKDAAGNTLTLTNVAGTPPVDDHVKPTVVSVGNARLIGGVFAVDVTFSEAVKNPVAIVPSATNFSFTIGTNVYVGTIANPANIFNSSINTNDLAASNILTVTFPDITPDGQMGILKIAASSVVDISAVENALAAAYTSGSIKVPDVTAPFWGAVTVQDVTPDGGILGGYRLIEVMFPEAMSGAMSSLANYVGIDDYMSIKINLSTLPGARLQKMTDRSVVIQIPMPSPTVPFIYGFEISNMADIAGNAMSPVTAMFSIAPPAEYLDSGDFSAKATSPTTIELNMTATDRTFAFVDKEHFSVSTGSVISSIAIDTTMKKVTLTLATALVADIDSAGVTVNIMAAVPGHNHLMIDTKGRAINAGGIPVLNDGAPLTFNDFVVTLVDTTTITIAIEPAIARTFTAVPTVTMFSNAALTTPIALAATYPQLSTDKKTITIKTAAALPAGFYVRVVGADSKVRVVDVNWTFGTLTPPAP